MLGRLTSRRVSFGAVVVLATASAPLPAWGFPVCVDPGHGGNGVGCSSYNTGATGYCFEKDMNLDVGLYLAYLLGTDPSFDGSLSTRTADYTVCLGDRVTFADNMIAQAFVSCHHNGIRDPDDNYPDPTAPAQLYTIVEYDRTMGGQLQYWSQSLSLANCVANHMCTEFSPNFGLTCAVKNPVQEDLQWSGFHIAVLTGNSRPAVLGEPCGVWAPAAADICRPDLFPAAYAEAHAYYDGFLECYAGVGAVGTSFGAYPFRPGSMRLTWTESDPTRNVVYYLDQSDTCWGPFYYAGQTFSGDNGHTTDRVHYTYDVATGYARTYWYRLSVASEVVYAYSAASGGLPFAPPAQPTNVQAAGADQGGGRARVSLTWQEDGPAPDVYWVYRSQGVDMSSCSDKFELPGSSSTPTFTDASAPSGLKLFYRVRAFNSSGGSALSSAATVTVDRTVAVNGRTPAITELTACRPNPARGTLRFDFRLAAEGVVSLDVYDVAGRLVAKPFSGRRPAGEYHSLWDGRGREQAKLGGGVYFARLSVDGRPVGASKLVLLR